MRKSFDGWITTRQMSAINLVGVRQSPMFNWQRANRAVSDCFGQTQDCSPLSSSSLSDGRLRPSKKINQIVQYVVSVVALFTAYNYISPGDTLRIGNHVEITMTHTPGHTPGDQLSPARLHRHRRYTRRPGLRPLRHCGRSRLCHQRAHVTRAGVRCRSTLGVAHGVRQGRD